MRDDVSYNFFGVVVLKISALSHGYAMLHPIICTFFCSPLLYVYFLLFSLAVQIVCNFVQWQSVVII